MSKNMNVPKLRFSEFGGGNYKKYSFEDIFSFSTGKNIKQNEASPEFDIPCVRYGELYHMYEEVITKVINKTNLDKSELLFSYGDEILMPSAGEDPFDIGSASALTIKDVAIGRTINILRPLFNNIYCQKYVAYYINQKLRRKISTLAKGSSISNVYNSDLKTLKINLPQKQEQEKIASFLTSIDTKIEQLTKKEALLQQYKKGVMQKIFNQELRFKPDDGSEFCDWEEKRLGDVCKLQSGFAFKSENFLQEGIPIIRISNISNKNNYIDENNIVYYEEINNDKNFSIKNGDLIVAMSGATTGKSSIYNLKKKAYLNQRVGLFRANENKVYYSFLIQFVFSSFFSKQLDGILVAGAQPNISSKDIENIIINLPSIQEQTKIANFLSSIDNKIEQTTKQLNQTKEFKKALLQQMFV